MLVIKPPVEFNYENFVEIEIDSIPDIKEEPKITETPTNETVKEVEKNSETETEDEVVEEEVKKSSVADLFGNSDNIEEVKKELKNYQFKEEKVNSKKASLNLDELFKNERKFVISTTSSSSAVSSSDSDENRYLKLIHKKLLLSWRTKPEDAGKSAQINFSIGKDGSFAYFFKGSNSNSGFYRRLKLSLEKLKVEKFPPPEKPLSITVNFIAKE